MQEIFDESIEIVPRLLTFVSTSVNTTNRVGRPLFDGKNPSEVVSKLSAAFSIDATNAEACAYAEISTSAYDRFVKKYPEFRARFDRFKLTPILKAKFAIYKGLDDPKFALRYLERRRPGEFSSNWVLRTENDRLSRENKILREKIEILKC